MLQPKELFFTLRTVLGERIFAMGVMNFLESVRDVVMTGAFAKNCFGRSVYTIKFLLSIVYKRIL